jgi:predicted dinucleotide-binding enzyme
MAARPPFPLVVNLLETILTQLWIEGREMIPAKKKEPSATSLEIQEDLSRDAIVTAFQNAMADHLRSHIPGTSINEETLLATDYLNQFHELVRLCCGPQKLACG